MAGIWQRVVETVHTLYEEGKMEAAFRSYKELVEESRLFIKKHEFRNFKPNVGVFGENSTGKSTFLNALLGNKDQFKMGFGETTDRVTALYDQKKPNISGSRDIVFIKEKYDHLQYMNLFDIPGFGQKFSHKKLQALLGEMDIVFWFIDASSGVKAADEEFLNDLSGTDTRVIVIYNKIDAVGELDSFIEAKGEIESEIGKIQHLFAKKGLSKRFVTAFPFSATKSLVGSVKGEKGVFKAIDRIVENILLYVVFVESYRSFVEFLVPDDEVFVVDNNSFLREMNRMADTLVNNLERDLKEEISILDSLNPFSGKDEKAGPIVERYERRLQQEANDLLQSLYDELTEVINDISGKLSPYNIFGGNLAVEVPEKLDTLQISIDLDELAWNSFTGDSFSEDVAEVFRREARSELKYSTVKKVQEFEVLFTDYLLAIKKEAEVFAEKMDKKLEGRTEKIRNMILHLLLGAIKGSLTEHDQKLVEKILHIEEKN